MFWYFGHEACGISAPWAWTEPAPLHGKVKSEPLGHQGSPSEVTFQASAKAQRKSKASETLHCTKSPQQPSLIPRHLPSARHGICYSVTAVQFSSVQSLSRVWLFATPWIAARQASLSITNSRSSLRPTSIESVMPSSHLILCHPLLLLPPIPSSIRVFSNGSALHMRWPKYWSFSFSWN